MNNYELFFKYIKDKIANLNNPNSLNKLNQIKNKLETNLEIFKTDISLLDKELIKLLLEEEYGDSSGSKYDLFLDAIELKDYLDNSSITQIKICNELLKTIEALLLKKLEKTNEEIELEIQKNKIELQDCETILSYFENNTLIRILSSEELEYLIDFISNTSINMDVKRSILLQVSCEQFDLYKQNTKKNDAKEKTLRASQESESTEESTTEELSLEEQNVYNEIQNIFIVLENEKFIPNQELQDALALIVDSDFKLENREYLYNMTDFNKFMIIYFDLKEQLIPNFRKYKKEILEIFKYIINLYNNRFVRKSDASLDINKIGTIDKSIIAYALEYDNLSDTVKKNLVTIDNLISQFGVQYLEDFKLPMSKDEYNYYLALRNLSYAYHQFIDLQTTDIKNDKYILIKLISDLNFYKQELSNMYNTLTTNQNFNSQEEATIEVIDEPQSNFNLPIMFTSDIESVQASTDYIKDELTKNFGERSTSFFTQNIADLYLLLQTPQQEIRKQNRKIDRLVNKKGYHPLFDQYDVNVYKRKQDSSSRLAYLLIHISDNNKKRLKEFFNLKDLEQLIFVLNMDATITSIADNGYDFGFVNRTHGLLQRNQKHIDNIINLFKNDFKDEKDFEDAISLIQINLQEFNKLAKEYGIIQSERSI